MIKSWGSGWSRHRTFGLRAEWIRLYLDHPTTWEQCGNLGNKQIESLRSWLKTVGIVSSDGTPTSLFHYLVQFRVVPMAAWGRMWTECVFSFPTAAWYVQTVGLGQRSTTELSILLGSAVRTLSARTCTDAILELVGLLERTPIGSDLAQGKVMSNRPRVVQRVGLVDPGGPALAYAAWRLFRRHHTDRLELSRDLIWPWVVFGSPPDSAMWSLLSCADDWLALEGNQLVMTREMEVWNAMDLC